MPDWKAEIRARLATLSMAPSREAQIVEELAQHLDDRWHELMANGMTSDDAARLVKAEYSGAGLTTLLDTLRQAQWREPRPPGPASVLTLDSLVTDVCHAWRALLATPSVTIGALLVLALGTGATTAIVSVVDAVALRPLPFPDPQRLVALGEPANPGADVSRGIPATLGRIEPQNYLDWIAQQRVFESIAAIADVNDHVLARPGDTPRAVAVHRVTASFFDVLRSRPTLGDVFTSRHEVPGSDHVVMLSDAFWRREFGGDPSVVGRTLPLDGQPWTIVGVMPSGFAYPPGSLQPAEIWAPWVPTPQERVRHHGRSIYLHSIARLKPGVSLQQAQAQMAQVAATIAAAHPTANTGRGVGVRSLKDHLVGASTQSWMAMLLVSVGIVLLIACTNVGNLWLARASVQRRDVAVRMALGASRARLVQRWVIESLMVSLAGSAAGLGLAWPTVQLLRTTMPEDLARVATIAVDARVLTVAVFVAVTTGLMSGLLPALQKSNAGLSTILRASSRVGGSARGGHRARGVLVVAEVALAVVLLVGAALFTGSFVNMMRIDPGFRSERVLTAQVFPRTPSGAGDRDLRPAFTEIVDGAQRLPGVVDAAWAWPGIPLRLNMWADSLAVPGATFDGDTSVSIKVVTPTYHRTLQIPLLSGRYFGPGDRPGTEAALILSDAAARAFFPGEDPLGRTAVVEGIGYRIVGVVADARQSRLEAASQPEAYLPLAQNPRPSGYIVLRTSGDPNDVLSGLRETVSRVLPDEPLRNVARLADLVAAQTAERRLNMVMFSLFALIGLSISAVGIFGVVAYLVSQQTRDIGIRMALGATRSRVVAGVLGHTGALVLAGLIVGSAAAWSMSSVASPFLFGLEPRDPLAYGVAMTAVIAAALLAAAMPARRAASISPLEAIRAE